MSVYSGNTGADFSGNDDTHIWEGAPTTAQYPSALDTNSYVSGDIRIGVLRFPPPAGYVDSTLSGVSLELYLTVFDGPTNTMQLVECLRDVNLAQATWNVYSTGNSWGTAGALGAGDAGSVLVSLALAGNVYQVFSHAALTAYIESVWNAGLPAIFLLRLANYASPDGSYAVFAGTTTGSDGQRPRLNFTATPSGGGGGTAHIPAYLQMLRSNQ